MSAASPSRPHRPGRRTAAGAVVLGCLLAGLSACSGGSAASSSGTAVSGSAPAPDAPSTSATGSGGLTAVPSPTGAAASSTPAAPAADAVLTISVKGRNVTPAPGRRTVSVGDRVQLVVTTDTANVLHVHGVEIEKDTRAGVPLTVNFTVKDPGIYAVELHEPELLLVQLVVR